MPGIPSIVITPVAPRSAFSSGSRPTKPGTCGGRFELTGSAAGVVTGGASSLRICWCSAVSSAPGSLVRRQRVVPASHLPVRRHQPGPRQLAERLLLGERTQYGDRLSGPVQQQLGVGQVLTQRPVQLGEPVHSRGRVGGQTVVRHTPPETERALDHRDRVGRVLAAEEVAGLVAQGGGVVGIQLTGEDADPIGARAALDPLLGERATELPDVRLQVVLRGGGHVPAGPDRVDQLLGADPGVAVQQEQGQHCRRLAAAEVQRVSVGAVNLERAQHPEAQPVW
jgi:hypothetical protein